MGKRGQFILVTFILTSALVFLPKISPHQQLPAIFIILLLSFSLSLLTLLYDLRGVEFFTLLTLPSLFALGVSLILYFFPNFSLAFRILLWSLFAFSFYITLLTENIFNVAKKKPLPLLRAAHTASFLITLFTAFLLFTAVFKADNPLILRLFLLFLVSLILGFQSVWTIVLPEKANGDLMVISLLIGLGVLETSLGLAFLPLESFFRALALSTSFYIFLGLSHQYIRRTFTQRSLVEYAFVALTVALILLVI